MLFKLVGLEEILPQMRSMQTIGVLIYLRRRLLSDLNHFWYDFITSLPLSFIDLYLSQALLSPCFLPEPFHKRRRKRTLCDQVEIFSLFQQSLTHMSNASNSHTPKYIQTHSLRLAKSQYTRERLRASLHRSQRHCMPLEKSRLHIRT